MQRHMHRMLIDTLHAEAVEARLIAQQTRAEAAMQRAAAEQARAQVRQTIQVTMALQQVEAEAGPEGSGHNSVLCGEASRLRRQRRLPVLRQDGDEPPASGADR